MLLFRWISGRLEGFEFMVLGVEGNASGVSVGVEEPWVPPPPPRG